MCRAERRTGNGRANTDECAVDFVRTQPNPSARSLLAWIRTGIIIRTGDRVRETRSGGQHMRSRTACATAYVQGDVSCEQVLKTSFSVPTAKETPNYTPHIFRQWSDRPVRVCVALSARAACF